MVAEVDIDLATSGPHGRLRHASRFLRIRPDLRPEDIDHAGEPESVLITVPQALDQRGSRTGADR
jgi:hypothetical protein